MTPVDGSADLEIPKSAVSKYKPVDILGWIASASTAIVGGLALIDAVPSVVVAVVAAIGVIATKLLAYATTKKVTPWEDVVSKVTPTGKVISGPADVNNITGQQVEMPQAA